MKGKLIKFTLLICFLCLIMWLFFPLSQSNRQSLAQNWFELILFDYNRINPLLFKGPIIKHEHGKEWFEWNHHENSDTIIIGVNIPKFRFLSLFKVDNYFLGPDTLWDKVYHTDSNYEKSLHQ